MDGKAGLVASFTQSVGLVFRLFLAVLWKVAGHSGLHLCLANVWLPISAAVLDRSQCMAMDKHLDVPANLHTTFDGPTRR